MTLLVASVLLAAAVSAGATAPDIENGRAQGSGSTPAAASVHADADGIRRRVKQGQKIVIVDDQGRELTGRIGELRADALVLLLGGDRTHVPYDRILSIDRPHDGRSDGALKGLAVGAVVGLVAALAVAADDSGWFDFSDVAPVAVPVLGGIGAVIGLAVDGSIRHAPNVYRRQSTTRISVSPVIGRTRQGVAISVLW
jgi:hypothetical protein